MSSLSLWLAAISCLPPDIIPYLMLTVMMNRFLRRRTFQRYLQPERDDDQVLVMLQTMLYTEFPFVDPVFRLRLMPRFGMTIFLINSLMRPGVWFNIQVNLSFFQAIDRVKRGFLSPPQQIQRAITMISNQFFQSPPFQLRFSIEGFSNWDDQLRFNLMKSFLRLIPADFAELPDFIALCRDLIVAENPFWESLKDLFIYYAFNQSKDYDDDDSDVDDGARVSFQNLLTHIESSPPDSEDFQKFTRLFQTPEHEQVLVPNDLNSFIQVIERFVRTMIRILPSLPGIRFENNMIHFSQRHELSAKGIVLSHGIMERLRWVHSLKFSEDLMNVLNDMNFKDSPECLVYRGFELLINLLKLIQESNGVIYTYIHACILIQTSTDPHRIRELCAMRDLFTTVTFWLNDESSESTRYDIETCRLNCYLLNDRDDFEKFLIECLLDPVFSQTLEKLLQCSDESDLEDFAKDFMENSVLVRLFRQYIQEKPKTWCRA
jgi:hypothetical protein